jgi:hypothetical protein
MARTTALAKLTGNEPMTAAQKLETQRLAESAESAEGQSVLA